MIMSFSGMPNKRKRNERAGHTDLSKEIIMFFWEKGNWPLRPECA